LSKKWLPRKELEARVLKKLKQQDACDDLIDATLYGRGGGQWIIGHVRLGPSKRYSEAAISEVQRLLAKEFLLRAE
jgi:hypothetical protein